ncbi:hypothetical protein ACU5B6_26910 [Moritella viscosa]|uniref:hypothetical protein n=1 Tax=Moritella viscosa TaxID=80854 RepID=UPI000916F95A|nr:hypothetical protein [Moritella viscosa]SHO14782.1 Putative uncharacterized protein [Moritella viscosa]SHO15282.1 Putative uncharacterized protein [Moritella viscosa]SHO18831.1 Putative uncharacterized protein [Moritella viscosa]
MRYESRPSSHIPKENQETTKERALRQKLERRAELTYTASDYQRWAKNRNRVIAEREKAKADAQSLPSYLTGDAPKSTTGLSYPAIKNTRVFPDENVRALLKESNQDVMLLTLSEAFEVLHSWGWEDTKEKWKEITQSTVGELLVNYGVNGKDVVTTSMIISKLSDFGIKATKYVNHKGTELIKLSGYAGIRKILNAPVFGAMNPKILDVGIGKYGLKNSIIQGARATFYVAAAFRTIDFILNDETSLAEFIGNLATDVVKIGLSSAITWGIGSAVAGATSFVVGPLVLVVFAGLGSAIALNWIDTKYGLTDKVVQYIESAQQEAIEKTREIEKGILDLGAMLIDGMLETGKEIIINEMKTYFRNSLNEIKPRLF